MVIKFKNGFTLIELLITIAVIGVLAAGAVLLLDPAAQFQKANDARRKADLSQIEKAIEQYYQDVGSYPSQYAANDYRIKGLDGNVVGWGSAWAPYMGNLPADPSNPSKNYVYVSTGQAYYIYASLDRGINDGQICKTDGSKCDNAPASGCGAGYVCNYGVSSPNVSP